MIVSASVTALATNKAIAMRFLKEMPQKDMHRNATVQAQILQQSRWSYRGKNHATQRQSGGNHGRSIGSTNGVSVVTDGRESGRGGMRSWMQAQRAPAVRTRIAGLVDLFRSPSKTGTNNSIPTNSSVACLLNCCRTASIGNVMICCHPYRRS